MPEKGGAPGIGDLGPWLSTAIGGSSRKLVSNEFVNPLLSSQRRLKVNPMYGNTKSRKRGVTRAATVISKTNKKNAKNKDQAETEIASTAKNEEEEAHGVEKVDGNYQPTQYYYDYDEDDSYGENKMRMKSE